MDGHYWPRLAPGLKVLMMMTSYKTLLFSCSIPLVNGIKIFDKDDRLAAKNYLEDKKYKALQPGSYQIFCSEALNT